MSTALLVAAVVLWSPAPQPDTKQLYRAESREAVREAAMKILRKDPVAALVTVDSDGQPRVRTVDVRPPEEDLIVWVATRSSTRKLDQIRGNPKVSLYFNVDAEGSYVSVMGTATIHDDLETKEAVTWRPEASRRLLWPDYPDDYVLIRIEPEWIEVIGEGVDAQLESWRPQAVELPGPR